MPIAHGAKLGTHACAGCGSNVPQKVGRPGRVRKWCPDCAPGGRYTKADAVACKTCGATVQQKPGHGKRLLYCSKPCRDAADRLAENSFRKVCKACGRRFTGGRTTAFCGRECRFRRKRPTRPCERCGDLFQPKSDTHRFCSFKCRQEWWVPLFAAMSSSKATPRQCLCCQKPFRKKTTGRNAGKYCSRECAFEARRLRLPCARLTNRTGTTLDAHLAMWFHSWGNDAAEIMNAGLNSGNHRQRCRRYGCHYEPIRTRAILDRDGWRCQICGCELLPRWTKLNNTETPHPRSPTIDHIVPLSLGGDGPGHRPDNVQAACWQCNNKKSDSFAPP